jgi:hypothetical protein
MVLTSANSPYGTACIGCRGFLIAPACSEYVTSLHIRHVWSCDSCGVGFETSDHLRCSASSEARRTVQPLPLFDAAPLGALGARPRHPRRCG